MPNISADQPAGKLRETARNLLETRYVGTTLGALFALVPITLYAAQFSFVKALRVIGFSIMVSIAAGVFGALLGFLFSVPRYTPRTLEHQAPEGGEVQRWDHNTNLEQVSDWLTKILIGVGLTEFREIGRSLGALVQALEPGLGGTDSSAVFGGLLLAYFGAFGFLVSYVLTVGVLPRYFGRGRVIEIRSAEPGG